MKKNTKFNKCIDSDKEPFFCENNKSGINQNISKEQLKADRSALILDTVRKHQPISCWTLEKITGIPHSTIFDFLRGMEFVGLVYSKKSYKTKNRVVRNFYASKALPKIQKELAVDPTAVTEINGEGDK
jgi:predicted transcriptional regulator